MSSETTPGDPQKNDQRRQRQPGGSRHQRRGRRPGASTRSVADDIVARFAACGRCSFFLSEYRLSYKPEAFETAVAEIEEDWLTLEWDDRLRRMVHGAFGSRVDIESYYFESCCPECRRPFVFRAATDDQAAEFRIAI